MIEGWLLHLFVPIYLFILLITLLWIYYKYTFSYWHLRKLSGPIPIWLFGNIFSRFFSLVSLAKFDQNIYEKYNGKYCCGIYEFTKPVLMIGNANLLKQITMCDFDHFTDRSYFTFNEPVMDLMLLGLKGDIWKRVRSAMTPSFTSGKIKQTFPLVKECTESLVSLFHEKIKSKCHTMEMKEVYGKFTMDTIANIAFGLSTQSFGKLQDEFQAAASNFPRFSWQRPSQFLNILLPQMAKLLNLKRFDKTPFIFFSQVISDTIRFRLENNIRRTDFLQLLLDASMQEQVKLTKDPCIDGDSGIPMDKKVLSELVITAQCLLFYIAGYDTTATTLSFVSYCLAVNPKVQQRLLEEIDSVLEEYGGEISFESIKEMKYLDMVFAETLRLYPPAPRIDRRCTKPYFLQDINLHIPVGMKILIPIYSIHRDPQNFQNPELFEPERFGAVNKAKRSPMVYLPFGSGPRNCIGRRFAMMESKVAMVRILQDFVFIPSKKTEVPIIFESSSGLLKALNGVWVRLAVRS